MVVLFPHRESKNETEVVRRVVQIRRRFFLNQKGTKKVGGNALPKKGDIFSKKGDISKLLRYFFCRLLYYCIYSFLHVYQKKYNW